MASQEFFSPPCPCATIQGVGLICGILGQEVKAREDKRMVATGNPVPEIDACSPELARIKPTAAYAFRGTPLTGIRALHGRYLGQTAVLCASGPSLAAYRDDLLPPAWPRFAINEAITLLGRKATYWVLSDEPIVNGFYRHCPLSTRILAMHRASQLIPELCPNHWVRTVNSMDQIRDYGNGYEFFSRRTVLIGAIEMARYMGFSTLYIFGLDLFRTRSSYYFDGKEAIVSSERRSDEPYRVHGTRHNGEPIFQTPNLRNARDMLRKVRLSGLWDSIAMYAVGSPVSQQDAIPKLSWDEFQDLVRQV